VSTGETILLGAVAGATIFLGLPLGRMKGGSRALRTFLNGLSAGILVFLLMEIFGHAYEPTEEAFTQYLDGAASFGQRAQRLGQMFLVQELEHGSAFATGQDHGVGLRGFGRSADERVRSAQPLEHAGMRLEIALYSENAYQHESRDVRRYKI